VQKPSLRRPPPSERRTVLVVDDDAEACVMLQRMLERLGLTAVTASDGAKGLARLHEGGVDLVVTDIVMPVMDGFEVIRALRAEWPDLPVVAVSGVGDWDRLLRMALQLGADASVRKPVEPAALEEAIGLALASRRRPVP
jgi:CheY-like chemotaxis protein